MAALRRPPDFNGGKPMAENTHAASRFPWLSTLLLTGLTVVLACAWLLLALVTGRAGLSQAVSSGSGGELDISAAVTRVGVTAAGTKVQVVYASPEYYERTGQTALAKDVAAESHLVFLVTEENHDRVAPAPLPMLRVDGLEVRAPARERLLTGSEHHRVRMIRFVRNDAQGKPYVAAASRSVELVWPGMEMKHNPDHSLVNPLRWELPLALAPAHAARPLSFGLFLTLTAGLFAALSPCLIQLTLYYLSTLAGVGAAAAGDARGPILRTALWFVAGVSIAYTLGGAMAGVVGQYLQSSTVLGASSRPVALAAGIAIVAMGLYTGASARAPGLCKLPLPALTRWARGRGGMGSLTMGFAIALGCLQCFGGAIFASLLIYVGSLGSPLMGAGMLFLFSLGLAVPFLLAALAWSRVTPLLPRLARVTPYIALGSSIVMIFLGGLMIADRFHWVSALVLRWMPFLQV